MEEIVNQLGTFQAAIMKIISFFLMILFVVGILHVVSAKSDSNPERFKKLIINYIVAVVFVLIALALIKIIGTSVTDTTLTTG